MSFCLKEDLSGPVSAQGEVIIVLGKRMKIFGEEDEDKRKKKKARLKEEEDEMKVPYICLGMNRGLEYVHLLMGHLRSDKGIR